ncbi:MAG: hypothetical protein WD060_08100 [Pirellulales bacterium]
MLLIASAQDPGSRFGGSDLPEPERRKAFNWLSAFHADPSRQMVWDQTFRIYDEYRNKLTDQDYGLLVVHEKMTSARQVDIAFDADGHAVVSGQFASLDPSDRKFLATVLGDEGRSRLVNASDTDWLQQEGSLTAAGVAVEHILEDWLRAKHAEKESRK